MTGASAVFWKRGEVKREKWFQEKLLPILLDFSPEKYILVMGRELLMVEEIALQLKSFSEPYLLCPLNILFGENYYPVDYEEWVLPKAAYTYTDIFLKCPRIYFLCKFLLLASPLLPPFFPSPSYALIFFPPTHPFSYECWNVSAQILFTLGSIIAVTKRHFHSSTEQFLYIGGIISKL